MAQPLPRNLGEIRRELNPLDHVVFQRVFGEIMTVPIVLEFNHTLRYVVAGQRGIVQAQAVILIAQLAVARKVIVAEFYASAMTRDAADADPTASEAHDQRGYERNACAGDRAVAHTTSDSSVFRSATPV